MELKNFQSLILDRFKDYLKLLKKEYQDENILVKHYKQKRQTRAFVDFTKKAWEKMQENNKLPVLVDKKGQTQKAFYLNSKDGLGHSIPNVCIKVPTGGGKTLIALHLIESLNFEYFIKNTGLVLWVVPTSAIYEQTLKSFKDKGHFYRQVLERASGGRVKILEKNSSFSLQDIQNSLCVMLLMLQSANRETKDFLRIFKSSGDFIDFFPEPENYPANKHLLKKIPNLDFYGSPDQKAGGVSHLTVKQSLGNTLRMIQPLVVLDEGHKAYSDLARRTISQLNPRFILELSATPNMKEHKSNVLISVSGVLLKEEEMIKIPINILNSPKSDWKKTLYNAHEKLLELKQKAQKYDKKRDHYIRPLMLIQVERTGKREAQFIHSLDAKEYLVNHLGIHPTAIRIKSSGKNELKNENLLSETSPVQYIITHKALQEGWDCPFAYVLAILGKTKSQQALTQLIGRILRQPYAKEIKDFPDLNESYVFCYNAKVGELIEGIKKGLIKEGINDMLDQVHYEQSSLKKQKVKRREKNKLQQIFLPRVLYKDKNIWRNIIYEADILSHINYSKISYSQEITPTKIESLKTDIIKIGLEDKQGQITLPEITRQSHKNSDVSLDFLLMTKRLCHFIPNPLEAGRILQEVLNSLKDKKVSDKTVWLNRNFILNEIENDIKKQVEKLSEELFTNKLKEKKICFKIFKKPMAINWVMDQELDFIVPDDSPVLRRKNHSNLQLSLFDTTYEKHYNNFEKKVAWYLDENQAIKWWHRMVSKQGYHLQGWQKQKVWPDFLAFCDTNSKKYIVLESKGEHLKGNEDSKYKKKLFQLLENYYKEPIDVGHLETTSPEEQKMLFKILMEKTWEKDLQNTIT